MEKIYLPKDWVLKGNELKPKFGSSQDSVIYEKGYLKPKWSSNSDAWTFNGTELKPRFGSSRDKWIVDSAKDTIKPYMGSSRDTYDLDGNPIIVAYAQLILKLW